MVNFTKIDILTFDLLKLFLPEVLVDHFELLSSNQEDETLHLCWTQKYLKL